VFKRGLTLLVMLLAAATLAHAGDNLPDPMRPDTLSAVPGRGAVPGWDLNSILISSGRRLAVINGRAVGPGDTVNGARVLEISAGAVKLSVHGKTLMLHLIPESVKHIAHQ
jgi:MSHA biogenesis protein MshK